MHSVWPWLTQTCGHRPAARRPLRRQSRCCGHGCSSSGARAGRACWLHRWLVHAKPLSIAPIPPLSSPRVDCSDAQLPAGTRRGKVGGSALVPVEAPRPAMLCPAGRRGCCPLPRCPLLRLPRPALFGARLGARLPARPPGQLKEAGVHARAAHHLALGAVHRSPLPGQHVLGQGDVHKGEGGDAGQAGRLLAHPVDRVGRHAAPAGGQRARSASGHQTGRQRAAG